MISKGLPFLVLLLLAATPLWAQKIDPELLKEFTIVQRDGRPVVQIGLQSILKLALVRAPQLEISRNRRQSAAQAYRAAQAMEPLTWNNQVAQSRSTSPSSYLTGGSSTAYMNLTSTQQRLLQSGLSQKLKNGISYGLSYQRATSTTGLASIESQGDQVGTFTDLSDPVYADGLVLSVNVPLFQDLGEVNRVSQQRSGVAAAQAEINDAQTRRDLLGQVASVYWDLVGITENIQALAESEKLASQFVQDNRVRLSLGALDPTEVKLAEAQLAMAQKNLLAAQIDKKAIEDQIRIILGMGRIPMEYEPTEKLGQRPALATSEAAFKRILARDPGIKRLEQQLKASRLDVLVAQNKTDTNLDLNLEYRMDGYGYDQSTASSSLGDSGLTGYQVGLTWSVPLFDRKSSAALHRARIEKENLAVQIADARNQLEVTYGSLLRALDLSNQSIALAQVSLDLNRQLLVKENQKFRLGKSTSYRVSQIRSDMLDAELALTIAKIGLEKTHLQLMLLTGEFERYYEL